MKKNILVALAVAAVLVGAGWYYWSSHSEQKHQSTGAQNRAAPAVATLELEMESISLQYVLPGRVSAYRQAQIRPQVDGIITERLFEEGANVERGQQLYQIDDARYKAALNSAIADLNSAQANVKAVDSKAARYKDLVKINAVSDQEYDDIVAQLDQAKAAVAVAQAAVDLAEVNLEYTKVYAPITGRISKSYVTEGALVTAGQSQNLAIITQLDPVYVDMQQSGTEAMMLRSRMIGKENIPVSIVTNEKTGKEYGRKGTLEFSEVTIDESTGSVALRALMPNPDGILLPGLFVRASIDLGEEEVLLVPQRAATRSPGGDLSVWVVDSDNRARQRQIQVDQAYEDNWIVTDGLSEGDRVIVLGYQKVADGAEVISEPWKNTRRNKVSPDSAAPVDNNEE